MDGCYTEPLFNQIIGVCKGEGCACGGSVAPGCAPEGSPERCGTLNGRQCSGSQVRCCFGANVSELVPFYDLGTQAIINYMAAYQVCHAVFASRALWFMTHACILVVGCVV